MVSSARLTGLLLAVAAAGNCLPANIIRMPRADFRKTYSLSSTGRVTIQNLYGDVRIQAWDREEVLVEAFKKSDDPGRLDDAAIVVDSSSGQLSIRTHYAGGDADRPASVEYRITVPRGANLENVTLVNGGLSVSGLEGSIKASSINGSIRAEKLAGRVELSTVNGRLEADFQKVSRANPITLSSVNGPIRLSLPGGTRAELFAHNLAGGIDSDVGIAARAASGHRLHTFVNRGGTQIRLNNVNGGIFIRAAMGHRDRTVS